MVSSHNILRAVNYSVCGWSGFFFLFGKWKFFGANLSCYLLFLGFSSIELPCGLSYSLPGSVQSLPGCVQSLPGGVQSRGCSLLPPPSNGWEQLQPTALPHLQIIARAITFSKVHWACIPRPTYQAWSFFEVLELPSKLHACVILSTKVFRWKVYYIQNRLTPMKLARGSKFGRSLKLQTQRC